VEKPCNSQRAKKKRTACNLGEEGGGVWEHNPKKKRAVGNELTEWDKNKESGE